MPNPPHSHGYRVECDVSSSNLQYAHCFVLPVDTMIHRLRTRTDHTIPQFTYPLWFFVSHDTDEFTRSIWHLAHFRAEETDTSPFELDLVLDSFRTNTDIKLYYIDEQPRTSFYDLEQTIVESDLTYERFFTDRVTGDNTPAAEWLADQSPQVNGWYDVSYPDVLCEVMLLPHAKRFVDYQYSEHIQDTFKRLFG